MTAVLSFVTNPSPPDRQLDQRRATGNTRQPPASTAVEVRRLFREDALIEVEAVAVIAPTEPSGR